MLPRTPYIKPTFKLILESAQLNPLQSYVEGLVWGQPRKPPPPLPPQPDVPNRETRQF